MSLFASPSRVLVRPVSATFAECLRVDRRVPIDVPRARRQHAAYVQAIGALGIAVDVVPAIDACPDGCFIEDAAVITGAHAMATRPGAPSRRDEVADVARVLAARHIVRRMEAPATLDGGDVLRVGSTLFVGLSTRTNRAGASALEAVAREDGLTVVSLAVRDGLHLKSACSLADESTLVYDASVLSDADLETFRAAGLTCVAASEAVGANVLALGASVLVSAAAPRTAADLRARGLDVHVVDVSEMHAADGALTCLSLRVPRDDRWST